MSKISRRTFVNGLATLPAAGALVGTAGAADRIEARALLAAYTAAQDTLARHIRDKFDKVNGVLPWKGARDPDAEFGRRVAETIALCERRDRAGWALMDLVKRLHGPDATGPRSLVVDGYMVTIDAPDGVGDRPLKVVPLGNVLTL